MATKVGIKKGDTVSMRYVLRDDDGEIIDSNDGEEDLVYVHGKQQIVIGLERELTGMKVGESKSVTVSPKDGYGESSEDAYLEIPIDQVPEEALHEGAQLTTTGENGEQLYPYVEEVRDDSVILNFNHPLAGQTLHFEIEITKIKRGKTE